MNITPKITHKLKHTRVLKCINVFDSLCSISIKTFQVSNFSLYRGKNFHFMRSKLNFQVSACKNENRCLATQLPENMNMSAIWFVHSHLKFPIQMLHQTVYTLINIVVVPVFLYFIYGIHMNRLCQTLSGVFFNQHIRCAKGNFGAD